MPAGTATLCLHSALEKYRASVSAGFSSFSLPWDPSPEALVVHVLRAREFSDLLPLFLKWVAASLSLRQKALRKLGVSIIRAEFCAVP